MNLSTSSDTRTSTRHPASEAMFAIFDMFIDPPGIPDRRHRVHRPDVPGPVHLSSQLCRRRTNHRHLYRRTNPRSKRSCEVAVRNSYSKKVEILYCLRILGEKYVIRTVKGEIYCTNYVLRKSRQVKKK